MPVAGMNQYNNNNNIILTYNFLQLSLYALPSSSQSTPFLWPPEDTCPATAYVQSSPRFEHNMYQWVQAYTSSDN